MPTPDRSKAPATGSHSKGIDTGGPDPGVENEAHPPNVQADEVLVEVQYEDRDGAIYGREDDRWVGREDAATL
jgi:hypothetical protein